MGIQDPKHVCKNCGHVGQPNESISGNFSGEVSVWIIAAIIANASTWLLMVMPLIYTIYRATSKKKVCEKCGSLLIIPADSPNGQAIISSKNTQ